MDDIGKQAANKYICELEARLAERNESAETWDWVKQSLKRNKDHAVIVTLHEDGNLSFLHGDPTKELEVRCLQLEGDNARLTECLRDIAEDDCGACDTARNARNALAQLTRGVDKKIMLSDEEELTLVGMSGRHAAHIRMVIGCNRAETPAEKTLRKARLAGFREGVTASIGMSPGALLLEADQYYIEQGIDRPMCGGVFL